MKKYWDVIKEYFPLAGFVLVVLFFTVVTKGAILSVKSMQSLLNQVMTTSLVALGAVFIFGSGSFDMSIASCVCLSAVLAGYAAIATGSILVALLVAVGVSVLMGLLKAVFAAFVQVPLFIVTIVLGSMIGAVVLVIMGEETTIYLSAAVRDIPAFSFSQLSLINAVALAGYFLICVVLFSLTRLGREVKILGGNPVNARQTGLDQVKIKMLAFLVGSVGAGLAAFLLLIRTRTVGATTAGSLGTDVLVALVLGGMPLTGGPRARITAGIVGAATITVLNAGLTMMGLGLAAIQICRAILFLAVVYTAGMSYRTKLLPR